MPLSPRIPGASRRRVTLTPGIRWEYIGSPHSTVNQMGTFDPNQPGGGDTSRSWACRDSDADPRRKRRTFNPRVGVAWDIFGNGKTVLRGGFGKISSFPTIIGNAGNQVPYGATLCNGPTITDSNGASTCAAGNIVVNRFGTPINSVISSTLSLTAAQTGCELDHNLYDSGQAATAAVRQSSRCPRQPLQHGGP